MIEVYKHQFQDLNELIAQIKNRNYKFIIYMDDLSFEEFEIEYKYLKAVIEGGLEKRPNNILIYATSNRRHLIKEDYSDKEGTRQDMHTSDLSLIHIFMSHSLINSFNYQIAMAKGGGSGEMGNAMTISAVSELPTMFLFGYLLKKKSSVFWFRLSGLFFVLKSIGTFLAFNIPTYYAAQPFQMFGWALLNVACVYYVDGIMEPQDSIKGQAYMAMTITAGDVYKRQLIGHLQIFLQVSVWKP